MCVYVCVYVRVRVRVLKKSGRKEEKDLYNHTL